MSRLKSPVSRDDHAAGPVDAAVTLVEYGDYQCPECAAARPVVQQLQERFGGGLRVVFRNFPRKQVHPHAQCAAETAEFAAAYGKFWEMHQLLFENQQRLGGALYLELARRLGLAPAALSLALEEKLFAARVRTDVSGALRSGVAGAPAFFINGRLHQGPADLAGLAEAVAQAMAGRTERPATPRKTA